MLTNIDAVIDNPPRLRVPKSNQPATTKKEKGNKPNKGGRPKGVRNKVTEGVKKLAQKHGPEALRVLVEVMNDPESGASSRIVAANAVLDRAYGKAISRMDVTQTAEIGQNALELLAQIGADPRNTIKQIEAIEVESYTVETKDE